MSECRVQLRRDRVDTAWGFRLQGGLDFNAPLVVQRVFSGSPADGQLQRGDALVSINNKDVGRMQQKQAEEFIKTTGTTLSMVVKRGAGGMQLNNVHQYANEPSQHPMSDGGSSAHFRPQPPASFNVSDGVPQPKRYGGGQQQNVWTPSGAASYAAPQPAPIESPQRGGGYGSFDLQQQQQQQPSSSMPTYQPVSFQKPAVAPGGGGGGYGGVSNQFSTPDSQAPKGSGGGPSWQGSQHQQPSQPVPVQHEFSNQGHHTASQRFMEDMPTSAVQPSIISQQQDDDDEYEVKSVREIKAMFNKGSKPVGIQRLSNKPTKFHPKSAPAAPAVSYNKQPSWNTAPAAAAGSHGKQVSYQQSRAFSPLSSSQPVEQRPSVFSPKQQDPYSSHGWPSLSPPPSAAPVTGLLKPKQVSPSVKPGAGYSYQGIVNVTPPKKVQQGSKSQGSGGGGPIKKKEFDPSQSLVFQMLQEENERAKRGETDAAQDEPASAAAAPSGPGRRRAQQQAEQRPQIPKPRGGSRLDELLERDRASAQQEEEPRHQLPQQQYQQQQQQQQYHPQQQQQQYHQQTEHHQYQQRMQPQHHDQQQSYQAGGSNYSQQQHHHQSPAGGYHSEMQQYGGYHNQQAASPGNYYQQGYQSYDQASGVPISDF